MRIGWSMANITPDRPVVLRGQFHSRISERVNDPLTATALAIEGSDGEGNVEQAVMVSCDMVTVPGAIQQRLQVVLAERLPDLDVSKLFLNGTHTHTGPTITDGCYPDAGPGVMTPTEYADLFVARVAQAVVEAWESRAPSGVSWAYGHAVVGHNRRASYLDGHSEMYGKTDRPDFAGLEGYEDHGVDLLFTWDDDGSLSGIVANIACPSQETEGANYVSGDFWHEVRLGLWGRFGDGVFVMPQCSAAGDQSPHLLIHKQAEQRMLRLRGLTEREEIARRIVGSVEDVYPLAAVEIDSNPILRHEVLKVGLPMRRVTQEEYEKAARQCVELEAQQPDPGDLFATSHHFVMLRRNRRVMARYEQQDRNSFYEVELHCLRLGDIAIATNPFEYFLDYGLRIKARSKAVQTFVVQLASGGGQTDGTYLPTERAIAARSYGAEAVDNTIGPEGGQMIVDRSVEALDAMW